MKFMKWEKDGGPDSTVHGFFFIEIKPLFSIVLLRFNGKSRNVFHTHAFNCFSWLLWGMLIENFLPKRASDRPSYNFYFPNIFPFFTYREPFHKVDSNGLSWVLSFRGPWKNFWHETFITKNGFVTRRLTHGRKEVTI